MSELAILVPVLARPHRVQPLLDSIAEATEGHPRVVFVCDPEDADEIAAIKTASGSLPVKVLSLAGSYAAKINLGFEQTDEPLVFMAADDLKFWPAWLERAKSYLVPGVDVVGTNDICNPRVMTGQHSTHTLFRRSYIERSGTIDEPGKVLHGGYPHEWCDDEFIQTAMARGVYRHAFDSIVEHLHPLVEKASDDDTYRLGRSTSRIGRRLFYRRNLLWEQLRS